MLLLKVINLDTKFLHLSSKTVFILGGLNYTCALSYPRICQ